MHNCAPASNAVMPAADIELAWLYVWLAGGWLSSVMQVFALC